MNEIVQQNDPRLRQISAPVPLALIGSAELAAVVKQMSTALAAASDGVALAAPQVGVNWRLFIVSGKLFSDEAQPLAPDKIFINPAIKKRSRRKVWQEEGCLSVRWWYGETHRAEKVTVVALDERGQPFLRQASGLLAQIFQHEIDHLDGKLFIDEARNLAQIDPEQVKNND